MPIRRPPGSKYWHLDLASPTGRIRESTGTTDRKQAQELHDAIKAGIWRQERIGDPAPRSWGQAVIDWVDHTPRGRSDKNFLRAVTPAIGPTRPLSKVTADVLRQALQGLHGATWNRGYNTLHAVLNHACKAGRLAAVPVLEKQPVPESRIRWATAEEWERLRDALPPLHRDMAIVAVNTGLRQANVLRLEWSQVDLRRRVAWIHADQTKGKRPLGVPLNAEAMAVLEARAGNGSRWVFPRPTKKNPAGAPLVQPGKPWTKARQDAGLVDFCWHDLRHTWAAWHVMSGTTLQELKELGGWRSYDMVLVYAHLAPDHLRAAADRLKPVSTRQESVIADGQEAC
jgi:integrase